MFKRLRVIKMLSLLSRFLVNTQLNLFIRNHSTNVLKYPLHRALSFFMSTINLFIYENQTKHNTQKNNVQDFSKLLTQIKIDTENDYSPPPKTTLYFQK